jgi:hypothetical protein
MTADVTVHRFHRRGTLAGMPSRPPRPALLGNWRRCESNPRTTTALPGVRQVWLYQRESQMRSGLPNFPIRITKSTRPHGRVARRRLSGCRNPYRRTLHQGWSARHSSDATNRASGLSGVFRRNAGDEILNASPRRDRRAPLGQDQGCGRMNATDDLIYLVRGILNRVVSG